MNKGSKPTALFEAGGRRPEAGGKEVKGFSNLNKDIKPNHLQSPASSLQPVLVIDTREQTPFNFPEDMVTVTRRALPAGDYTLEGLEDLVVVERKSLDDLVKTLIQNRERFHRELCKLQNIPGACVVVEAGLNDLLSHQYKSGVHPNAVLGAVLSVMVDFGIPVYFCGSRPAACRFVQDYLLRFLAHSRKVDHAHACQRQPGSGF